MPLVFRYSDPKGVDEPAETVDLGNDTVRFGTVALEQSAELGQAGVSGLEIDDPDGEFDFVGLRALVVTETSAPSNNSIVYRGAVQNRTITRAASFRTGSARVWSIDLVDYNWHLTKRVLVDQDSKRPDETAGDRIRWLLADAAHINIYDYGHVTYPTQNMEANDYRGQTALDVLADCAIEGQYNFWCEYNEAHQRAELFFIDPNDETEYPSSIRLSNDIDDVDNVTTFAPSEDAQLVRSADRIAFGVYLAYARGSVYVRRQTTGEQFSKVDQTAPMANVKREARARRIANRFLNDHDEETDRITCWFLIPAAKVNSLRAGQVMQVKFTHFPGYQGFVPVRVLRRTVRQQAETVIGNDGGEWYRMDLEAVPLHGSGNFGVTQTDVTANLGSNVTFGFPQHVSADHVLVSVVSLRGITGGDTSGNQPIARTAEAGTQIPGTNWTWVDVVRNNADGVFEEDPMLMAVRTTTTDDIQWFQWSPSGNFSGSSRPVAASMELSGVSAAYEGPWKRDQQAGATSMSITGITVSGPGILFAGWHGRTGAVTAVTSGFVELKNGLQYGSFAPRMSLGYKLIEEAGTYSLTWTVSSTGKWSAIAIFLPAA